MRNGSGNGFVICSGFVSGIDPGISMGISSCNCLGIGLGNVLFNGSRIGLGSGFKNGLGIGLRVGLFIIISKKLLYFPKQMNICLDLELDLDDV